ncbi:MAG: DUF6880 family protein [Pseudomonadota bacterium]
MTRKPAARPKPLTAETLAALGAERLAEILLGVADTRADLKRRLRMEVAAGQGPQHLVPQIDKRLGALQTSRGQVTWRQKPAVVRDLDAVRELIAERLAPMDPGAALERMWLFLETSTPVGKRFRERDGAVTAVYARAAADLGRMLGRQDAHLAANALVDAVAARPQAWAEWLPETLPGTGQAMARIALTLALARGERSPGWQTAIRHLADAAGDVEAFRQTYTAAALATPQISVEVARRYLAAGELEAAGDILRGAAPKPGRAGRLPAPDFDWESAWIDYLQQSGDEAAAQAVRWASFERTLDVERARAFTKRLDGFDDVEAEQRAFAYAAEHADFERGLRFLMAWPALLEASRMIQTREEAGPLDPAEAELWASKLRRRYPAAAHKLLRRAAAAAFRRRDFKVCDRLTQEAETIPV